MSTTAKLYGPVTCIYNSYCGAVLFTKQCHSAKFLSFFYGHFIGYNGKEFIDLLVYPCLYSLDLLVCKRFEV